MEDKLEIFTDGGSRGNPGPGACGFVVFLNTKEIFRGSKYLGRVTNNQAEYLGVVEAYKFLESNNFYQKKLIINFYLDSELVVRQLSEIYKIKNPELKKYFLLVKGFEKKYSNKINYSHIEREKNIIADSLVNFSLDKNI